MSGVVEPRRRWWAWIVFGLGAAIAGVVAVLSVIPAQWVAEGENPRTAEMQPTPYARIPSLAQPVADRVRFGDLDDLDAEVERYGSESTIYFVTVSSPSQSVLSWLIGRDDPAIEFLTYEQKYGFQTPQQRRVFSLESMRTSGQVAQFVALERLGYDVDLLPGDVLIAEMVCLEANDEGTECVRESPSAAVLQPGDRILEVEGAEIATVEDLSDQLAGREPGDVIEMVIERAGEGELTVDVELTASTDDEQRTIVGFIPFDTRRVVLPFELAFDTGEIGGPSAGLAFTLTLIDELTPGSLTGGVPVAVTGTIELDGRVGAVGGLRQKASAAAQNGVEVFIVPRAQGAEDIEAARRAGGEDMRVIPVDTLDEALAALESLGGDPLP